MEENNKQKINESIEIQDQKTELEQLMEEMNDILKIVDGKTKSITVGHQGQIRKLINKMCETIYTQKGEIKAIQTILTNEIEDLKNNIKITKQTTKPQQEFKWKHMLI